MKTTTQRDNWKRLKHVNGYAILYHIALLEAEIRVVQGVSFTVQGSEDERRDWEHEDHHTEGQLEKKITGYAIHYCCLIVLTKGVKENPLCLIGKNQKEEQEIEEYMGKWDWFVKF